MESSLKSRLVSKVKQGSDKIDKLRQKKSRKKKTTTTNTLVLDCIEYLDSYGLQEQGLYRVPGLLTEVQKIQALYQQGPVNLFEIKPSINTVATMLKQHFREGEPIFSSAEMDFPALQAALNQLPSEHFMTLSLLCAHLARVCYFEEVNKMSISNICVVWCPSIQINSDVLEMMISNGDTLFHWNDNPFADEEMLDWESSDNQSTASSIKNGFVESSQ
eukprot:NODE_879_length_3484_cov_0.307238.p2 type:complete len:218 gc:universal NODE_879_length_3484_cov_0.307238:1570-917(-)